MEAKVNAEVELDASGTIDATVDSIVEGVNTEQKMQAEADADATVNDSAELNAISEGSYELK